MDPAASVPLHFTLQIVSLAGIGLLLAWSLVRRRWPGAMGALLLATAEALYAGRFLESEDDPALLALRFVGAAFLVLLAVGEPGRRRLLLAAIAAIVAGAVWGGVVGGGVTGFVLGSHLLSTSGAVAAGAWAWVASRDSVRLRVLAALMGILALTLVVGGGAVSRVTGVDKRDEQTRQLGNAALAVRVELLGAADDLVRRAALISPLAADELSAPGREVSQRLDASAEGAESITIADRDGEPRFFVAVGEPLAYERGDVLSSPATRSALSGDAGSTFDVSRGLLVIVGSAPVYRPGGTQVPEDVIGAVAIVQARSLQNLRDSARTYEPGAELAVAGPTESAATEPQLDRLRLGAGDEGITTRRITTDDGGRTIATTTLGPHVRLVVGGSDAGVVDAATGLLRALLIAILASAVLAVVVASWLSARISRPILDLADEAERAKTDFLSSVSHELRTPLTPIRGYAELLRRGRVPSRRAAGYLDEIGEAAQRLERIITLLIDVAAMEAERFRIDAADPRPGDLLTEAADRWRGQSPRHPVRVKVARSVPRVHGDPVVLARILDELIDNAIKFSPEGGAIGLSARRTRPGVEISVSDEGVGLPPELSGRLAEAFSQLDTGDRRRFGGLGLGLAFVSGALRAHGSVVSVQSEPGTGTTFSFTLPTAGMVTRMPAQAARSSAPQRPDPRAR